MWLKAVTFYLDVGLARGNLLTVSDAKGRQTYINCKLWIEIREKKMKLKHSHIPSCALEQTKLMLSLSRGQR